MGRPIPRISKRGRAPLSRRTAQFLDVPAPIGGKNSRDSQGVMAVTDAIDLTNWLPTSAGLRSRNGSADVTTSYSTEVESVIPYVNATTKTFITAEGGELFTDDAAGTAVSIETGLTNDRWFGAKIAANMVLVNGADAPRNFDGSVITTPSLTGDVATHGTTNIDGVTVYRNRMYLWDTNFGNFFFGGVNSVSGAFTEFNLDQVSSTGGNILEINTISRDGGDGPDDTIVFILDTGEIIEYAGSNPGDASNFALIGKYMASPLVARNCTAEFGGDVLMLTQSDVVKLSDVIKYGVETGGFNVNPSKLSGDIKGDFSNFGTNYGWQITTHPAGGWIIINVPETANLTYHQYIIDTVTGTYTRIEGWLAIQFGVLNEKLFFGSTDDLVQADVGLDDKGADIALLARAAYSNLGIPGRKKVSNARMYIESEATVNIDMLIAYDYSIPAFQGTQSSATTGAEWDTASWDTSSWAGITARRIDFVTSGIGIYVTTQTKINVSGQTIIWYSTTYNFDVSKTY